MTGRSVSFLLETDRLILREFEIGDASSFYALNNDNEVMRYTGDKAFESLEHTKTFLANYNPYQSTGMGRWTVILKMNNYPIGWCGLKMHANSMVDLGYRFHKKYWNRGYATEAANASLEYGFQKLHLNEIIGRTAEANLGSIRVLEKIGMKFWKKAPCEGIEESVHYKITQSDYLGQKNEKI